MDTVTLEVGAYRLRFAAPYVTSTGTLTHRSGLLVRATGSSGVSGYGDIAPLPGFGGGSAESSRATLRRLMVKLRELDDGDQVPASSEALAALVDQLAPHSGLNSAVLAGVTLALADLAARTEGLTLARWLDPRAADRVTVNAVIGAVRPALAADTARSALDRGYTTLKVKLGGDEADDLERLDAIRAAVGSRIKLRIDVNGAWPAAEAITRLRVLEPYDLEYVEQPTAADDIESLAEVRRQTSIPIAADESLLAPGGAEAVLESAAADVLVLKPSLMGGVLAAGKLAERARRRGVSVVVTTALESAIGRLGALHLSAALCARGQHHAFGLATGELLADDVAPMADPDLGELLVPTLPGLGAVPDVAFELP